MSGRGRSGNPSGGRGRGVRGGSSSGGGGGRGGSSSGGGGGRGGSSSGGGGGRGGSSSSSGGGGGRGGSSSSGGSGRRGGGSGGRGHPSSSSSSSGGGRSAPSSSSNNSGRGGGGRVGGGSGSGSRRYKGRGDRGGAGPDKRAAILAEQKRLETERKQKDEEEAAAAAAAAEAERKRRAELERRQKLQSGYESSVQGAMGILDSYTAAAQLHGELRGQLDPDSSLGESTSALDAGRQLFELSKKKLKSDLKKCTAFVKKIKAGTYPSSKELESPNNPIRTLNLTRYVEEVASALMEPQTKVKQADVPGMVMLCVEMHRRYPTFAEALIPTLLSCVSGNAADGRDNGGPESGSGLPRRICFRLLTEFVLHGIITDMRPMSKVIHDAAGVPSEEGREYVVKDANLIVTFAKTGGNEILGVVPRSVKGEMVRLKQEVEGRGEGMLVLVVPDAAAVGPTASAEETAVETSGDAKKDEQSPTAAEKVPTTEEDDLGAPFTATLSPKLQQKCQTTIDAFNTTAVPAHSRAVSPPTTSTLHKHCLGAYRTLSASYVTTHRRLLKLEKRCDQDRLLQGNLSEAREKGLKDAQSLMESLKKSVETLSEALDVDVPVLEEEEAVTEATDGKGIELWTKNESGAGDEKLGPFDDEETRSFYCDVPDLLSTKPPALLGINANDLEKQKERNLRQYGGNGGEGEEEGDEAMAVDEVGGGDETEPKEESAEDGEDDAMEEGEEDAEKGENDAVENKDTPHYKLMVLLEQELPEASRRETIDELADRFCSNHGSNAKSRKRLYKTLFLVPRTRLDLLPYWSRFAAVLDRVYSDSTLVLELEQQMHGQARFKKNQNIESRLRTVRYLGELTKFRVAPPIVVLRGLRRCLEDFSGYNIDVACCLLESCGRYLYRMKHTHSKLSQLMDTMMRIKKARNLDERHVAAITSAFMMVNPPPQTARTTKEVPPLEAYLRHLLMTRLEAEEKSISFVSKQIQRMPWSDPGTDCGALVCKYMLKACRKGRYKATKAIASLSANLKRSKPEVPARLIDDVLEEIQWFMEHPNFRDHQRTLVCARVLGELYCAAAIPSSVVFDEVHHILDFDHDIPQALRQASENQGLLFVPHGNISQTILEDEELEEDEEEDEKMEEEDTKPQVVTVSSLSKYDPRVPSDIDPPTAVFRIKLVCTILETASSHIVTVNNKAKLEFALASLQRYLFTKKSLPSDVEFSILDLFDSLDSGLKTISSGGGKSKKAAAASFVRYSSWLDAHQFVVATEKTKTLDDARVRVRVLAQAGLLGADDASIDGDLLDGDADSVELSDEEESLDKDSVEGDSDDDSVEESVASGVDDDNESESGSSDDGEESSNDEEGDEIAEAAAEAAYMRQLQDEEFESELRRLTMDALEKGKVSARTGTGGKVSSQMPAAPEFIAKKPAAASDQSHSGEVYDSAASPFGGEEGGMAFKLFKRGNKGKQEEVQLFVPKSTNLARRATKQDDKAARERDMLKAKVLQYEAESMDAGGNVYIDETKLQVIRNRPLTMETINKNFGKSTDAPYKVSEQRFRGRGPGRGRGGGRLFNPGRGRG
mmetsp:Transcript_33579/g.61792  ORF Transcript_33579/g.61792 Transcript_33579/m.61792 type:complete len:1566 (-) Transcript_33579:189-4886(-)